MEFTAALIWLVQNPTGFIVRGTDRCWGLSHSGFIWMYETGKPQYARISVRDIVAADWEPTTREVLEARAAQSQPSG